MTFNPNNEEDSFEVELEFLGKDSMLFKQTIDFGSPLYNADNGMGTQVFKNFKAFCQGKKATDDIFETLTPTILNQHLSSLMPGLSAKVFRTYNASVTLQVELKKKEAEPGWGSLTVAQKVTEYNAANRIVAILCNHQKVRRCGSGRRGEERRGEKRRGNGCEYPSEARLSEETIRF